MYNVDMYFQTIDRNKIKGFFTEKDGVSISPYMNYDVRRSLGLEKYRWVRTRQIHSDKIAYVDKMPEGDELLDGYDALVTGLKGICLVTVHADCVPVQIYDLQKEIIAAVHAGWRGTALGIAEKTAKFMGEELDCNDLRAYIGPSISACCYEVGEDVKNAFEEYEDCFTVSGDKYMADLKKINGIQLQRSGVKSIVTDDRCTYCDDRFISYRKTGSTLRMASGIFMTI